MTGFNDLLGINLIGSEEGDYIVELIVAPQHLHDKGYVHGGVILSMLDIVMSRAIREEAVDGFYAPTLELTTSFIRPLKEGIIQGRGRVVHKSRRVCRAEAELFDKDGKLAARACGTMMFVEG